MYKTNFSGPTPKIRLMQLVRGTATICALALAVGCSIAPGVCLYAQNTGLTRITVDDGSGAALAGAHVRNSSGQLLGSTGANGSLKVRCSTPCSLEISAPGFASRNVLVTGERTVRLKPADTSEEVTVTAYLAPLGELESPASTRVLSHQALNETAAVTLDGKLGQIPGVHLFRRTSSLVANPTSQGISLRGLGSTSASRTLVTENGVPLNDPIGDWIHWEEVPELSIHSVELVRGGASDLYGSSAIGGVINIIPVRPTADYFQLRSSYGNEGTFDDAFLASAKRGPWGLLAAGGLLGTDGYIQIAPFQRGPIDTASNVHSRNALLLADHDRGPLRLFARISGLNESRHNGTFYQRNATRLVRYSTGADWENARGTALSLLLYGSSERYRQTFSSISNAPTAAYPDCFSECSETPAKLTRTSDNELGGEFHWSQTFGSGLLLMAGADTHDVRVWDKEQLFLGNAGLTNLHDHQRDSAPWGELMWNRGAWTAVASGRMDWFQNYDAHQVQWTGSAWVPAATQPLPHSERLFDPRLGVSRRLFGRWAVSASAFRAFRFPTPSELYRTIRVGNELIKANSNLKSERATGWETGIATAQSWGSIRASYFLTQVNRPITSYTINPDSSPILRMRENLGQIESRGVSLDFELTPLHWLAVDGGYQYAHAVVSRGTQDYNKWIPEVPRNMGTLNVRAYKPSLGVLSLQARISGHMFDDDANHYVLSGFYRLDAYASHQFGSRFDVFVSGENLTNRQIEVGKIPETRLGQPRVARIGFQIRLGDMAK